MIVTEAFTESMRQELNEWLQKISIELNPAQWAQIELYLRELEAYNKKTNLTADAGESLLFRHVADGLAVVPILRRVLPDMSSPRVLDLGAGGGFVGISLKIAWPDSSVTLMESSQRKFQFLNWAAAQLKLPGLKVAWKRAAGPVVVSASPEMTGFDAVLARALAPVSEAIRLAFPLVARNGVFIAHQTSEPRVGDPAIRKALDAESAELAETVAYRLPRETSDRHLLIFKHRS